MSAQRTLWEALTVLGPTGDAVAARLQTWGFRGRQSDPADCPLARYLREACRRSVHVETDRISLRAVGVEISLPTPAPCREFLMGFDTGRWPALVEVPPHEAGCPEEPDHCICDAPTP